MPPPTAFGSGGLDANLPSPHWRPSPANRITQFPPEKLIQYAKASQKPPSFSQSRRKTQSGPPFLLTRSAFSLATVASPAFAATQPAGKAVSRPQRTGQAASPPRLPLRRRLQRLRELFKSPPESGIGSPAPFPFGSALLRHRRDGSRVLLRLRKFGEGGARKGKAEGGEVKSPPVSPQLAHLGGGGIVPAELVN